MTVGIYNYLEDFTSFWKEKIMRQKKNVIDLRGANDLLKTSLSCSLAYIFFYVYCIVHTCLEAILLMQPWH